VSDEYDLANPDRVTVGTVGPVGERMFILQVRQGRVLLTLKVEKAQVSALSRYLGRLLGELRRPGELPEPTLLGIEGFEVPDFVVGALGVSYDEESDRVVIVAEEVGAAVDDEQVLPTEDDDEPGLGASARLSMTREQAAALAIRGTELVEAGRPPCPLCGYPLDPRGHSCPRTNGHRPPLT